MVFLSWCVFWVGGGGCFVCFGWFGVFFVFYSLGVVFGVLVLCCWFCFVVGCVVGGCCVFFVWFVFFVCFEFWWVF